MAIKTIQIQGMTCEHCQQAVTEELSGLKGVTGVDVTLNPGQTSSATITTDREVPAKAIRLAIEDAGYSLIDG